MCLINIQTWNLDWFRNGKRSENNEKYFEKDWVENSVCSTILDEIEKSLNREKAITFLQEVPYQEYDTWKKYDLLRDIFERFDNEQFGIVINKINKRRHCNIAIYKKQVDFPVQDFSKQLRAMGGCKNKYAILLDNRTVCVSIGELIVMGVHMPTCFREDDAHDMLWKTLIQFASQCAGKKLVLVGDFNAYIGCKCKETESRFIELSRIMRDIVPDNIPTFIGGTPIDHVFVNFYTSKQWKIDIEDEFEYSDHKYINIELIC